MAADPESTTGVLAAILTFLGMGGGGGAFMWRLKARQDVIEREAEISKERQQEHHDSIETLKTQATTTETTLTNMGETMNGMKSEMGEGFKKIVDHLTKTNLG